MALVGDTVSEIELTDDRLLGGKLRLSQPRHGYRVAIDPVLLAATVTARAGEHLVDFGCGAGTVSLCVLNRLDEVMVSGVERDPGMADLARHNAELNDVQARFTVHLNDVRDWIPDCPVDQVVMNPPYLPETRGDPSPVTGRRAANVEGSADLADWIAAAERILRPKGRLTLIHRADRLPEIMAVLAPVFGDIRLHPLWPKAGREAKRVLIGARKGVGNPAAISPGTVLHRGDGRPTETLAAILDGAALTL